jgi:hypothetical protein
VSIGRFSINLPKNKSYERVLDISESDNFHYITLLTHPVRERNRLANPLVLSGTPHFLRRSHVNDLGALKFGDELVYRYIHRACGVICKVSHQQVS